MSSIDKIKQNTVIAKFPYLENHPASPNWLYLPREIEEFDERVKLIVREIKKKNPLFGSLPKMSKPKSSDVLVDFSKPQLFADLPKVSAIKKPKTPPKKKALPKNLKANKKSSNQLILSVLKRSIK